MAIKSILCIFGGLDSELNAVNTALLLGKAYSAHIRFLHISPDPSSYAGLYGEGIVASAYVIEAIEKENATLLKKAKQHVESLTAKHHVPLDAPESPVHHASAQFLHLAGTMDSVIGREGRLSDLIIAGRGTDTPNTLYDSAIIAALFNTGRPVMLLPKQKAKTPAEYKTIALAWKGTLEAGRAMYNAMAFLEKAEKVYVLTAEGRGEMYDLEAEAALMEYLHTHHIKTQGIVVAAGERTPAEALLMRAKELKAELLVMGAYGHSRFREMLLGGVTNYMLEKADIPLLLSH